MLVNNPYLLSTVCHCKPTCPTSDIYGGTCWLVMFLEQINLNWECLVDTGVQSHVPQRIWVKHLHVKNKLYSF